MAIPTAHVNRRIYHFTHIDNLAGLLQTGFLANNHLDFPRSECRSVAEQSIQARRAEMEVCCGPGGVVHDYVPLYFGSRCLMLLAVVNKKNVDQMDMLYFEFPISLVNRDDVVFTDASANTISPPTFYSEPSDLEKLNWTEIDSLKWRSADDTLRHQRMAEVLVLSRLPLKKAVQVVVWNQSVKELVQQMVNEAALPFPPIGFESSDRRHYFVNFADRNEKNQSIVTGPRGIAEKYESACEQVTQKAGRTEDAPFRTPRVLLDALRQDFGCLPQTAELVGLKSENGIHKRSVDIHTLEVVEKLKALPEFTSLPSEYQNRVELAAYLHDIGKGPKARWANNGGLQKVDPDHPVHAMPMMVEILTEHVKKVKPENAQLLLKLVCYHDLVGEVLGKGRDEQQIINAIGTNLELDMLFALGKADATSLVEWWWDEDEASALYDRCRAAMKVRDGV